MYIYIYSIVYTVYIYKYLLQSRYRNNEQLFSQIKNIFLLCKYFAAFLVASFVQVVLLVNSFVYLYIYIYTNELTNNTTKLYFK